MTAFCCHLLPAEGKRPRPARKDLPGFWGVGGVGKEVELCRRRPLSIPGSAPQRCKFDSDPGKRLPHPAKLSPPLRSFTDTVGLSCGPRPLIWASPHPLPSCPHRVLHQQLLHRGGCHELLQAAGAAPGRQRDQAQRHARRRAPLPAPGQPHRDLSATGRRAVPPRLFAFGLMVWFGFCWKVWDRPCDRGPWALSLVFFPVGSFRWSQGTGSLLLRDMKRPFLRQK